MGKKNYTNGIITKRFGEDDIIPDGWYRGVAPMSEEKKKEIVEKRRKTNLEKYGVENPSQAKEIKDKKKSTFLEKYGVENPAQVDGATEKAKNTCIERYGVENPSQLESVKKRKKETCLKNYGVEHPMQSQEVRDKSIQTCLDKYGVEHISKSDEIKERVKETCLKRYKVENPMQSEEIKERLRKSNLEKYGVEYTLQAEEIKEKRKETNLERYGVEHIFQSGEIKEKIKQTNLERYGVENPFSSLEIQEKIRETNIENLGVSYPMQSQEVRDKSIQTSRRVYGTDYPNQSDIVKENIIKSNLEKYGVERPAQSEIIKEKTRRTNIERFGVPYSFQSDEIKEKSKETCLEKYGVEWPCQRPEARAYSNDSKPNRYFASKLSESGISYEREFTIGRYSYDFKVGNILIEINPYATHNLLWSPFGNRDGIGKDYHYNKSKVAEENGFHCIHIFDWDSIDKIIGILKPRERTYARSCEVRDVSDEETKLFLNNNHLQGSCRGQEVKLGLYYKDELVSIMTFGKPRYNKNYQYELLRYCSTKLVLGGEGRLFKDFLRNYNPKSIISYCDRAKFRGDVYKSLEFIKKDSMSVSKHWYSPKEKRHITDNLLRQRGYDQLFGESYGKGTSNEELMIKRGYLPICDCGQDVWVYINERDVL